MPSLYVREAIGALPPEQRAVMELAHFSGRTQAEIAGMLGLPLGTVKGRLRLGFGKVRNRLGPPAETAASWRPGRLTKTASASRG